MKSLDIFWRDSCGKQCLYALILIHMLVGMMQLSVIHPKHLNADRLHQEKAHLMRHPRVAVEETLIPEKYQTHCRWEKQPSAWHLTGDFSTVYACVMQEKNTQAVAAMRFQKHHRGVSITLHVDEMPA